MAVRIKWPQNPETWSDGGTDLICQDFTPSRSCANCEGRRLERGSCCAMWPWRPLKPCSTSYHVYTYIHGTTMAAHGGRLSNQSSGGQLAIGYEHISVMHKRGRSFCGVQRGQWAVHLHFGSEHLHISICNPFRFPSAIFLFLLFRFLRPSRSG